MIVLRFPSSFLVQASQYLYPFLFNHTPVCDDELWLWGVCTHGVVVELILRMLLRLQLAKNAVAVSHVVFTKMVFVGLQSNVSGLKIGE